MGIQVVVADDEPILRELISESLTEAGVRTSTAENGAEGLKLLEQNKGVQLLVTDIKMPVMNGYQLVDEALMLNPELKVLIMTGYAAEFPPPAALKARELRLLNKPIEIGYLTNTILEMLARP